MRSATSSTASSRPRAPATPDTDGYAPARRAASRGARQRRPQALSEGRAALPLEPAVLRGRHRGGAPHALCDRGAAARRRRRALLPRRPRVHPEVPRGDRRAGPPGPDVRERGRRATGRAVRARDARRSARRSAFTVRAPARALRGDARHCRRRRRRHAHERVAGRRSAHARPRSPPVALPSPPAVEGRARSVPGDAGREARSRRRSIS